MYKRQVEICTIARAAERGIGPAGWEELTLCGDDYAALRIPDYKVPASQEPDVLKGRVPGFLARPVNRMLRPRPIFLPQACIGCGICAKSCPPHAITMADKLPHVDLQACIRCFCCHELCPQKAVEIRRSRLIRWLR